MLQKLVYLTIFFLIHVFAFTQQNANTDIPDTIGRVSRIDNYLQKQMKENNIPGLSLAVVREGKIIFQKGYGTANLELKTPVTPKSVFAIYSISKTFTAIAIMMLVEQGKVSLEEPISKYITDVPSSWNRITIRHLLTHTSGLGEICEYSPDPCQTSIDYTQEQVVKMVASLPQQFEPGEKWEYNNSGYFLLGMVIEKVSGRSYETFLKERIFSQLHMHRTRLENFREVISDRADGYTWIDGQYKNAVRVSPTLSFSLGGLISTVEDLAKYDSALYTEKLLKRSTLDQMFERIKLNNGQKAEYGLGFGLTPYQGHRRVGHSGGQNGFATTITRLIDKKITVIILSNADSKGYKTKNGFLISDIANEIASFYFN